MKKRFFYNSLTYFVAMVGACLVNLLVCSMATKIVNLFVVVDYFTLSIVSAVMSFVTVGGVLGALGYYEGFKTAELSIRLKLGEISLAGVANLLICVPLMFHPFIAGGTRFLAGLIDMGRHFDSPECIPDIYLWTYLFAFAIYLIAEIAVCIGLGVLGKRRRMAQRKSLTEQN